MDSKQFKLDLKEAKDAIKNKDVNRALKLCKAILKVDRRNYRALVYLGAALQESDSKVEAVNAFKKAIELSPDQILAWQGLASYYEKERSEDFIKELVTVYYRLLILEKEETKKTEIVKKLNNLAQKTPENFVDILGPSLESNDLQPLIADLLLDYFLNLNDISNLHLIYFKKALFKKIESKCLGFKYVKKYIDFLYQLKKYDDLLQESTTLLYIAEPCTYFLEVLCRVYCELCAANSAPDINVNEYCNTLLNENENSPIGLLTKAVIFYQSKDYVSSRDLLNQSYDIDAENWLIRYYLSSVHMALYCFEDAVSNLKTVQKILPKEISIIVTENVNFLLLKALSACGDNHSCNECILRCQELLKSTQNDQFVLKCLIRAYISIGNSKLAESKLLDLEYRNYSDVELTFLKAFMCFKAKDVNRAITLLSEIPEEIEFLDHWLLLGKLYWEEKNYSDSVNCFFKAGKLAPHVYVTFLYLGHFYRDVNKDLFKAKRCYEKAFQLNRHSDETALALSDVYKILEFKDNNLSLLSGLTIGVGKKWAWLRLGLFYLENGDPKLAVNCLRWTVRTYPDDSYCWEILGDAYFARGSFTAALKSYQKCVELNSPSLYPLLQISIVKQQIGLNDESIHELRIIVEKNEDYLPALKALADACLSEAKNLFHQQLLGRCRDLCQEGISVLARALKRNNRISCIWKLLADICSLISRLPKKLSYLMLSSSLLKNNINNYDVDDQIIVYRDQLLDFSVKCLFAAMYLTGDYNDKLSFLWHDIAFCYNVRATYASVEERIKFRKNAFIAAKKSVFLNIKRWEHWNLLGVIALTEEIDDVALAQHCFIRSIKLENSSVISWSNLGSLYLQLNDIELANDAFQHAQRVDPKYSRSWIGQAIIAESVDHFETVDLFYHTVGLCYHQESAKGFGEWVCKIFKNWGTYKKHHHCFYLVQKMFALQVAAVALTWYIEHNPDDSCAANMLSVLCELCHLNRNAVLASENSLRTASNEHLDIVRSNLGRQLRKLGKYEKAVSIYKQIKKVDFVIQCDLALSLYKSGQLIEALSHYESAIHCLAPDNGCVAQVMVATAALNYLSNNKEEAKTILFRCIQLKPVPVHGLFAACAFGMLNLQLKLSKLVLKELELFKRDQECISHVAFFNTYCEVFQRNYKPAIQTMSKFIYDHPGEPTLWLSLCLLLLNLIYSSKEEFISYGKTAAYHARCAISLGRGIVDISKIYSVVSLSYLIASDLEQSLKSSKKAVFLYPDVAENWAVLFAVQYSKGVNYSSLRNAIKYVQNNLSCSKSLHAWLTKMEEKVTSGSFQVCENH